MITVLTGPHADSAAVAWARAGDPPLWLSYDTQEVHPGAVTMRGPSYQALAAYAQRRCHPKAKLTEMSVADISALRTGQPTVRHPHPRDFEHDADLLRVSKLFTNGLGRFDRMVFGSFSAFYDKVLAGIGAGIATPRQDKVLEFGMALAADALTRLVWDLDHAGIDLVLITWDLRPGKNPMPHLPTATLRLADTVLYVEDGISVLKSASLTTGQQITIPDWLEQKEMSHV